MFGTNPAARYRMAAEMGLRPPMPSLYQRRAWEMIDSRLPPDDLPADGEFATWEKWRDHAPSWIGFTGVRCMDAKDRPCHNGADMARARDEGAFPVRWYDPERYPPFQNTVPAGLLNVFDALAQERLKGPGTGMDYAALRKVKGLGNLSRRSYEALTTHAWIRTDGDRCIINDEGLEEITYLKQRLHRAACVRDA